MLITKEVTTTDTEYVGFTCHCCKKTFMNEDDPCEMHEALIYSDRCGYGSPYDGDDIEISLCHDCMLKLLGKYIRRVPEYHRQLPKGHPDIAKWDKEQGLGPDGFPL